MSGWLFMGCTPYLFCLLFDLPPRLLLMFFLLCEMVYTKRINFLPRCICGVAIPMVANTARMLSCLMRFFLAWVVSTLRPRANWLRICAVGRNWVTRAGTPHRLRLLHATSYPRGYPAIRGNTCKLTCWFSILVSHPERLVLLPSYTSPPVRILNVSQAVVKFSSKFGRYRFLSHARICTISSTGRSLVGRPSRTCR